MPFPIDAKYVVETEEKLSVRFPPAFHTGMARQNGGEVNDGRELWRLFPVADPSSQVRVRRTANDIVRETTHARTWSGFPQNGIALGTNDGGDYAILMPEEDDATRLADLVFAWNHETGEMRILAPTVEILLNSRV